MFKKMLFRGSVLVMGLIASQAVIEKFEKSSEKRKTVPVKVKDEKEEVNEITEEEVVRALAKDLDKALNK